MKKIKCPICNNFQTEELLKTKDRFKVSGQDFGIRKCSNCKIVFTFPALNWGEMKKFYPKVYSWKKKYRTNSRLGKFLRKLEEKYVYHLLKYDTNRLLKTIKKRGKILDVGCGTGLRLEIFRKMGFKEYYGIEPSEEALFAKKVKKLPVERRSLDEFNCPENSFDIITLYHVLEHLNNPNYQLKVIKKNLKPKGWLVIQVPNFGSYQAKLFREKWFALDVPRHYFHYTPTTISWFLSQNGFEIKKIDQNTNFLHPIYWVLSTFPFLDPQLIWEEEEQGKQTTISKLFWIFLTALSILPAKLENLLGKGGNMTIYAVNQK